MHLRKAGAPSFVAFLVFLMTSSSVAKADFFLHTWEDHYEPLHSTFLDTQALIYSTSSNYDPTGTRFAPTTLTSYTRYEADGLLSLGVSDRFSIFGRLSYASINLNSTTANAGTAYGLTDQSIGANYRLYQSNSPANSSADSSKSSGRTPFIFDLQLQADLPAYNNNNSDTNSTPYFGDGTVDVTFGGFLKLPLSQGSNGSVFLTGGLGYSYRSSSYSAAIPWSVLAHFERHGSGLFANAGAVGYQSLKNDGRGITVASQSSLNTLSPGSGGSFITSAINPSLIRLQAHLGYKLESGSAFLVGLDQSVWGQDAPYGTIVSFGFQTHFGEDSSSYSTNANGVKTRHSSLAHQGFVNYSMDAHVMKSNDRLNLVKIDKGQGDGVEPGQVFDIYKPLTDGSAGEAVARCEVVSVKSSEAALSVTEYYKEIAIEDGFLAKRLIEN
jgi:hypothetical protein